MSYSIDFRRRPYAIRQQSAVCRMFGISAQHNSWQNRADTAHNGLRNRKLNRKDFEQHVIDYPDALQRECGPLQGKRQFHSADGSDPKKKQTRYRERDFNESTGRPQSLESGV